MKKALTVLKEQRCCIGEGSRRGKGVGFGWVKPSRRQKGKEIRRKEKTEGGCDNETSIQGRFCVRWFR